ncbi:DUF1460 domain-containing protein [Nocardia thailandica]
MRVVTRVLLLLFAACCALTALPAAAAPALDDETGRRVDELVAVRATGAGLAPGALIEVLSRQLLGTPYRADMLVGSATVPEQLVVDLRAVDCFTYLDYIEAARRSGSRDEFVANVIAARYTGGLVDFTRRKHFFTDWANTDRVAADDITASLGAATTVTKQLNAKADGGVYLPGIPVTPRAVAYLPSAAVDAGVIAGLRTGDYLGAYADAPGLDVTHVGIFVDTPGGPVFRNASSLAANGNQVVDTPLRDYLATVPGLVVLRPRA